MTGPRLAHVGIAVPRIADALPFYRDVLGLDPGDPESSDGASIVSLAFGDVHVELLEPRDPDGPIARFLAKRGAGIHHVCYRVAESNGRSGVLWAILGFIFPIVALVVLFILSARDKTRNAV